MIDTTEILSALQARLEGDANLVAVVPADSMGNQLPQDGPFPHIRYTVEMENMLTKDVDDLIVTLTLDVWSAKEGDREILQVRDLLYDLLDNNPLTMTSAQNFGLTFTRHNSVLEPDGVTRHGINEYSLLLSEV